MSAFRRIICALAPLAALVPPAAALDFCDESWLTRNLIIDRYGYCFTAPLAQALFDNADCSTWTPRLSDADMRLVSAMRAAEGRAGCAPDLSRAPSPEMLAAHAIYDRFLDIPGRDGLGWACWGFVGAPIGLHAGASPGMPVVGALNPGNFVGFRFRPRDGWTFATVYTGQGGAVLAQGWMPVTIKEDMCAVLAG